MEQLLPAARLEPQEFVCRKSPGFVPPSVIPEILSGALPVLVRVMFCVTLVVPTVSEPNDKLVGEKLTAGAGPDAAPQVDGAFGGGTPFPPLNSYPPMSIAPPVVVLTSAQEGWTY
jgi:hypothetical protein